MNELGNQFGSAIIVSYFLEVLKNSNKFKFLNQADSESYKKVISAIAAFITTIGIHYTFDYDLGQGGQLILALPSFTVASHAIIDFAKQWAFQQFSYDVAVKEKKS